MNTPTEIRDNGLVIGRVWEVRPGNWGFATPGGSQGEGYKTFEDAESEIREIAAEANARLIAAAPDLLEGEGL